MTIRWKALDGTNFFRFTHFRGKINFQTVSQKNLGLGAKNLIQQNWHSRKVTTLYSSTMSIPL
jgi:hypothetical protein